MIFTYFNYIIASVVALALIFFAICMRIAYRWRRREWLAIDFVGIGVSYLITLILSLFWFVTESPTYIFSMALFTIFFNIFLSYAVLRMLYHSQTRPINWFLLAYFSTPFVYIFKPDLIFISFQIMLVGSLITFASFLLLATVWKRLLKIYAISGMLGGLLNVAYLPVVMNKAVLPTVDYSLLMYFPVTILLSFAFYGLLHMSLKYPNHFVRDYDHRKDGR